MRVIEGMAFLKKSKNKTLVVPSNITLIEEDAYYNNDYIKQVILHEKIKSIGDSAFYMCTSLKKINLPESISSIDENAFDFCSSLKEAIIPSKVKIINSQTFSCCKRLKKVTLPKNLERIENRAFEDCISLDNITIPNSVNYIGHQAFKGCSSLKHIEIPNNIEILDQMMFYDCSSLKSIILPNKLKNIAYYFFSGCKRLKSITLPNTLNEIGEYAFNECTSLHSIKIPDSVTKISKSAFSYARNLEHIKLPINLEVICDSLFYNCKKLKEIVMPSNVRLIGKSSFLNCKSIEYINIPSSVSSIGTDCFNNCRHLKKIDLSENNIKIIENCTFFNCVNLTEVVFPSTIQKIGEEAFCGCKKLQKVIIPKQTLTIANFAFHNCKNITEISLPEKVSLDYSTFDNLSKCKKISLYNINNLFEENIYKFLLKNKRIYINHSTGKMVILGRSSKEEIDEKIYHKVDFENIQNNLKCNKLSAILLGVFSQNKNIDYKKINFVKNFINYLSENRNLNEISRILNEVDNTIEYNRLIKILNKKIKLKECEYYYLFKFANNLGAFNEDNVVRQKACNFIENLIEKGKINDSNIRDIFSEMEYSNYNSEWANFVMEKKNIDILLKKDEETTGYIARVYNEFFAIKEFYRRNRGSQSYRKVTISACDSYFSKANFVGITLDTIDIAPVISLYTKNQTAFIDAKNIRKEYLEMKKKGEIKDHILNEELKEKRILEDINNIKKQILKDSHEVINELNKIANEKFTYEFLSKYDPANFILGKYCSCCAHIEGVGYSIMHASIVNPNCQNLVIRNRYGRIIAKSTLYINKEQGYGVFNTIEVNECLNSNELKLVYEKFKKAVYDFAEKYNEENEIKLIQINVGMSMNDLSYYIRNNDKKGKVLRAIDFSTYGKEGKKYMGDWNNEQYIVWKR